MHRNTLRNPSSERLQGRLREMVKVITAAATLSGDIDKAIYWFRNEPIADYDHMTAAELVTQGHSEAVLAYLCDLENGARAGETRRPAARARRSTAAGSTGRGSRRCICRAPQTALDEYRQGAFDHAAGHEPRRLQRRPEDERLACRA